MTLTLLLDLDDTLIDNDINKFLPAYLKALGRHLEHYVAPDQMAKQLLAGTQKMILNNDPSQTLEQVFDQAFYPAIGRTKEEMRAVLVDFYEQVFPELKPLTRLRPEAVELISWAQARGHTSVVATNPIFPRRAILHRLEWAGLQPDQRSFSMITDYETFHFAKPNPAFITEILAKLGWPNQPAVMIGNSLDDDLIPAARLNLPVFWVTDRAVEFPAGFHPLSKSGTLADVAAWAEQVDAAGLRQNFNTPAAMVAVLKSTPAAFDSLSMQLTSQQWRDRPAPEEWSLTEIFCHLRDVDHEVNIPRVEKIVSGEVPFLAGINTDTWANEREYLHQDGPAALQEFIAARMRLVQILETLTEADWQREARHAIFGPTTLRELVSFIVTHDRSHIQQGISAARTVEMDASKSDKLL